MKLLNLLIIFVFISLLISCQKPSGSNPDTIITNAKIWSNGKIQDFDAIGIKGEKIKITGKTEDVIKLKSAQTKIIDAQHQILCPGFIDAHVHFLDGGFNLSSVQLRDAASRDTFIQRIKV
ncbi:MAG: hypothetical protein ABIR66_02660, partial [Saprospiraceae bacterium]